MTTPKKSVGRTNRWGRSSRFYPIHEGKEPYPSVTTILSAIGKPALINWAANTERTMVMECSADLYQDCPLNLQMSRIGWITSLTNRLGKMKANQKELAKASEVGSQIHSLIEWSLRASLMQAAGSPPSVCAEAQWGFMAWEDWRKSVNLKPIFIEQTVWSDTYGFAGTLDLLAEVDGKLTVLDWKSSKALYPESDLQNSAYRQCVREMGHGDPQQGIVVRLPKNQVDPGFEVKIVTTPEDELLRIFLATLDLWKWMQAEEKKREERKFDNEIAEIQEHIAQEAAGAH